MAKSWIVTPEWRGQTVYVVAGGVSVETQDLELLRGRRTIVINSSYERVPWADVLFFGDVRWWDEHKNRLRAFKGRICTASRSAAGVDGMNLWRLAKIEPSKLGKPGLTTNTRAVVMQWTSTQAALNLAAHLTGATTRPWSSDMKPERVVLLGADMRRADDGRTHHHSPHKWNNRPGNGSWDIQMKQLVHIVEPLRNIGVEVINVSPVSRITWWPRMTLEEAIRGDTRQ